MEKMNGVDKSDATVVRGGNGMNEEMMVHGIYHVKCFDAEGNLKWEDEAKNLVVNTGKNLMLDTILAPATVSAGCFMGLISSVSWSAVAAGDTMASHAGWLEAGSTNAPTFAARLAPSFSAASAGSKTTSATVNFTMTGAGTVEGPFIVTNGGSATLMNTSGTLFSAAVFSGGAKTVANNDVLQVTYTCSV
jgi:hypothetical protein